MSEEYNAMQIAELGGEYRIYYSRRTRTVEFGKYTGQIVKDRVTNAVIRFPSEDGTYEYGKGESFCHPKDPFNKKTGRAIALGRAVSNMSRGIMCEPSKFMVGLFERPTQ